MIFHVGRERHPPQPSSVKISTPSRNAQIRRARCDAGKIRPVSGHRLAIRPQPCDETREPASKRTPSYLSGDCRYFFTIDTSSMKKRPLPAFASFVLPMIVIVSSGLRLGISTTTSFHTISVNTAGSPSAASESVMRTSAFLFSLYSYEL